MEAEVCKEYNCKNSVAYNKKIHLRGLIGRKPMTYKWEACFHLGI